MKIRLFVFGIFIILSNACSDKKIATTSRINRYRPIPIALTDQNGQQRIKKFSHGDVLLNKCTLL